MKLQKSTSSPAFSRLGATPSTPIALPGHAKRSTSIPNASPQPNYNWFQQIPVDSDLDPEHRHGNAINAITTVKKAAVMQPLPLELRRTLSLDVGAVQLSSSLPEVHLPSQQEQELEDGWVYRRSFSGKRYPEHGGRSLKYSFWNR